MTKEINKFTRIRAAEDASPVGAFAVEIPSNAYVTGNQISKSVYNQTEEKDNGGGDMGSSMTGDMLKSASNVYLEKLASMAALKSWPRRLVKNIKEAEPLTQLGLGVGAVVGAGKAKAAYDNTRTHKTHAHLEERSLKTLQAINRNLNKAVVTKSSILD
jgi:hypothetical protein